MAFLMLLSLPARAQHLKVPAARHGNGDASAAIQKFQDSLAPNPPAACRPCLFYGGDLNPNDPNASGLSDENTLLVMGGGSTYGAVNIPPGNTATVQGVLFNVQASAAFDPRTASYDIRTGVSEDNAGTSIASGTTGMHVAATGRTLFGVVEYTVTVQFPALTLAAGEYWFNVTPTCSNELDGSCSVLRQFASNTTQLTNNFRGSWQPIREMFVNSSYFGYNWVNWCDAGAGLNQNQCAGLSFGLLGGIQ